MKTAAAAADRVRRPASGVVILIYHRVGERSALEVDLPAALFDEQMALLAERGCARSLDDAVAWLDDPNASGPAPVVVTFDDGTEDLFDVAMPILERHAIPTTLYVATAFVEEQRPFPAGGRPLTWGALGEMHESGLVDIGSHTHTHALLDRIDARAIDEELDQPIRLVEQRVGVRPNHFAYPKALPPSLDIERHVRSRYRTAALAGTRANAAQRTDVHRLARTPVQRADGMRWFEKKVDGGMRLEDDLRRAANRIRYARATR